MEEVAEKPKEKITYKSYKKTDQAWLEEIPEHWEVFRGNYLFDVIDKRSKTGKETLLTVSEHKGVRLRSDSNVNMFMAENYTGYKLCAPGDLVINSLWAWSRGLGFSKYNGIVSTAYSVYRPRTQFVSDKFLNYLLRTDRYVDQYQIYSKGIWISRLQLSDWAFLRIPIITPPLPEQQAIAAYLDEKTAKIETAIAQKQKLIELLKERKQIVIQELVTGKKVWDESKQAWVKPAETVDSGIEWIGEIPKSWEVKKLRYISNSFPSNVDKHSKKFEKEVRLCNYTDVYNNEFILKNMDFMDATASTDQIKKFTLKKGDVIITKDSESADDIASPAMVKEDLENVICGYHLSVIKPKSIIESEFLLRQLQSKIFNIQFELNSNGITRVGLGTTDMRNASFLVPPLNEQKEIVKEIQSQSTKIDQSISLQEQQIEKLKEYKQVLIDEVVRGKRRVV